MGIAIGNVLLPSLIKRDFPEKVTSITGLYALAMGMYRGARLCGRHPARAPLWGWRHSLPEPSWRCPLPPSPSG